MKLKMMVKNYWRIVLIGLVFIIFGAWLGYTLVFKPTTPPEFGYHALKINGRFISPEAFFKEKNSFFMRWRRNVDMVRKTDEERIDLILEEIINKTVIEDYLYHHSGITVTPREADAYINRYIKPQYASPQDFNSFLKNADYKSEADLQKGILLYLLKLKCFSKMAKEMGVTVSSEELDSLYQKHVDENHKAVTRHILVSDTDSVKARQRADDLYRRLKSGADFRSLAGKYSDDAATGSAGGLQPPFSKADAIYQVAEKIFTAKPGELIPPFQTPLGYEIVQVDRFIQLYHPKAEFVDMVLMRKFGDSDRFKTWIAGIRSGSSVKILDPAMRAYRKYREGHYDQAGALYEKAFRKGRNERHLQRAIESFQMAKNWAKMVQLSQVGMRNYPEKITYDLNKAEGLYRKGRINDALVLLKNAEIRSMGTVYFKESVIKTYAKLGLEKEAERMKNTASK